jgi:geranylgeranyl reductase family protein
MEFDVAIVGAGPAGAYAAFELARRGARVAILDGSHPREKPCGGGITGRALTLAAAAIGDSPLASCRIRTARFINADPDYSEVVDLDSASNKLPKLVVMARADFDARLLASAREAGATFIPERVVDVAVESTSVRVETARRTRCRAAFIVGADGANSLVRRRLARPFSRAQLSIATGYFVDGVTSDQIVIELTATPPGYIWSFPRPGHLAIGICAQADSRVTSKALRRRTEDWIAATQLAESAALRAYSWPIPSLDADSLAALELSGPRWALVGDAAGLVDPITREGIYFGLRSAQLLSDALVDEGAGRYATSVRGDIISELERAARFKSAFFQPRFTKLLLRGLRESAAIRAVIVDLIAGQQSYATLRSRLIKTLNVPLAWRMLVQGAWRV